MMTIYRDRDRDRNHERRWYAARDPLQRDPNDPRLRIPCRYWNQGHCNRTPNCPFRHG